MISAELINLIKIETTGKLVEFEVPDTDIQTIINDAIRRVRPWYIENFRFETIQLTSAGGNSLFFEEADLQYTPGYIEDIWGTVSNMGTDIAGISNVSSMLGLPSNLLYYAGNGTEFGSEEDMASMPGQTAFDDWFITYSHYIALRPSMENMSPKYEYLWDSPNIYVSGVAGNESEVSVIYAPLPQNLAEITIDKALNWVQDYSIARTKIALGRARGKFRQGGLNFETDSAELVSEGKEEKKALEEELKELCFNPALLRA